MEDYIKELVENLTRELIRAAEAYYNGLPPVMSDASYDNKLNLLYSLEKKYPQYKLANSPTQNVGANVISSIERVKHDKKQLSLDKAYSYDEVVEFIGNNYPVVGSYKGDGLTIVLSYEDHLLVDAVTRGNGEEGERVLHAIRVSDVPQVIPFGGSLKLRCEAIIPKAKFEQIAEVFEERGIKPPGSARNLVAGTVRSLNSDVARERGVELKAFELLSIKGICSYRIYQLPVEHPLCFRDFEEWEYKKLYPKADDYQMVYQGTIDDVADIEDNGKRMKLLDRIFTILNIHLPLDYKARSLSVSDVVVLDYQINGVNNSEAYFVNGLGFKRLDFDFSPALNLFTSDYHSRRFLTSQGFTCIPYELLFDKDDVARFMGEVTAIRDDIEYDIDGIVFMVDRENVKKSLSCTATHPLYAIAYKFPNKGKVSTVSEITWQPGMFALTPVVTVDPPLLFDGICVSKATAHNLNFLLGKSDKGEVVRPPIKADRSTEVFIERSGDVIPKITEVYFNSAAVEFEQQLEELYPKTCPACGATTEIYGVDLRCTNPNCIGKLKAKLSNMVSRNCLDIRGFGEKTIDVLVDQGFIKSPQDIFTLQEHKAKILLLDGYGEKKVSKLFKEIKATRDVPLHNVIASLCIPFVGLETARNLVPLLSNGLVDLLTLTEDDYLKIDGIGEVIARNIVDFVNSEDRYLILCFLYNGLGLTSQKENIKGTSLAGKTFVVTGTLFDERSAVETLIRQNGGKVASSVSSKTDFLVVGDKPGKSKLTDAEKYNVATITGDELLSMIA